MYLALSISGIVITCTGIRWSPATRSPTADIADWPLLAMGVKLVPLLLHHGASLHRELQGSTPHPLRDHALIHQQRRLQSMLECQLECETSQVSATQQSDFSISSYGRYDSPKLAESIANQSIFGTYLTIQKEWNSHVGVEIGGRWNRQSTFGDFSTVNVNPYWKYSKSGKAFFNYYTSFKTPSLYQLFSPYGNLGLKPEQGKTFELGFEQNVGNFHARLVGFQNNVKDGIVFQSISVEPYGKYGNVSQQTTQGLEAELSFLKKKWTGNISYTYLSGTMQNKFDGKDSTYSSLIRRPSNQLQARLIFKANSKFNISFMGQFVGERKDYFYDESIYSTVPKILKSYLWTELQLGYQMTKNLNASLMVKNLLGQEIVELYGYSGQARNFQASLYWKF